MRRAVFLDRDGVVNRNIMRDGKPCAPRTLRDFRLLPAARQAVAALRDAGFLIFIVTNHADIGNGFIAADIVRQMHERLGRVLAPDAIEMCPDRQDEGCACRKPQPGMLTNAAERLGIDLASSIMIGDRWSDMVAGRSVGCYTILVQRTRVGKEHIDADAVVPSLRAAARRILLPSLCRGSLDD